MKRLFRILMLSLLAIGVSIALAAPGVAADCGQVPVQIRQIGHPIWKPVDFHVFTQSDADFVGQLKNLLYPLRHQWCDDIGVGPGSPHQPPYIHEFEGNLDILNLTDSLVFKVGDFSPPNGVWAVWMTVPNPGTTGSSPDFSSGPIIPNSLFPIHIAGETFRNNQLWDQYLGTFDVPPLEGQFPSCRWLNFDGQSHFPVMYAEDASYGPGGSIPGHYEFRVTMTDTTGNGWFITVKFTVQQ
jgi:hypothetical protein